MPSVQRFPSTRITLQRNRYFLWPFAAFLLTGGIILSLVPKPVIHLAINGFNSHWADVFFEYYTFLGDGITVVIIVIVLLFIRFGDAFVVAVSNILCALTTQVLKHSVFEDALRPKEFFSGTVQLHFVPGVELYSYNSFPSGHAAVAFATSLALAMMVENKLLKLLMFFAGLSIAFSRVYLSQHFFGDIYAGSIIGVLMTLLVAYVMGMVWPAEGGWTERSLLRLKKPI